jgi:eukaryotic-like serine/threonine-protein kinase
MPRADQSLRAFLEGVAASLSLADALPVLVDIADSLIDLSAHGVVHRDIKPENVLQLDGRWCLADFGISRYAEATTAIDTQKYALSPPYAAPERWRAERASSAADVYAVGVMAFEMLDGRVPFKGPTVEDFREQHLHAGVPALDGVTPGMAALVDECLFKAPEARPSPQNLRPRLDRQMVGPPNTPGLSSLVEANRGEVARRSEQDRRGSEARSEAERRSALMDASLRSFPGISESLRSAIENAASAARVSRSGGSAWTATLGGATIRMTEPVRNGSPSWAGPHAVPPFDVIASASLPITVPPSRIGYRGRSHSLWYCDAVEVGRYGWYETAFMVMALLAQSTAEAPFQLGAGEPAARALLPGLMENQVTWPFTELIAGDFAEFVDRWGGWFAQAANGTLGYPSTLPERDPGGSWRRQ